MPKAPQDLRDFKSLLEIVKTLRGPEGCPWDRQQTHQSLTRFAIEEAFELAEAIDKAEDQELKEELGDLLFQVVLHSEIARQEKRFSIEDVLEVLSEKMVRRHPHVFSDVQVADADEVIRNWSDIKAKEKASRPTLQTERFDIPEALPSLIRSQKIGEKTKKFNFDWSKAEEVLVKVDEEFAELKEAMKGKNQKAIQHELGDLLFAVAQLARHLDQDAEQSLRIGNSRFETRFFRMKSLASEQGKDFSKLPQSALEELWKQVKLEEPRF